MRLSASVLALSLTTLVSCGGSVPEAQSPERPREAEQPAPQGAPPPPADASPESAADEEVSGAASGDDREGEDEAGAAALVSELGMSFERFDDALASGAPDCVGAERFRKEVCRLAERICDLTSDLPASSSGHARCEDGRQRCQAANQRYQEACH